MADLIQRIPMSQWKHPIDSADFTSMVATPVAIEKGKNHFFETKDSTSDSGYSLKAKVRMTFAGLRTKNRALYLPDEHYKSARSFISPFPKPIQVHHKEDQDPIGRVIDVRYIDTMNEAVRLDSRVSYAMKPFLDQKSKPVNKLQSIPTFLSLSNTDSYHGVGHIMGLWNVTDPDAIKKILDGRYFTVSTAMAPKGAYCSSCAQEGNLVDWATQMCEHDRGDIVDGVECVAVPFLYEWEEVSPVNNPAAPLSQIVEIGENLSFADAVSRIERDKPYELFSDLHLTHKGQTIRLRDSVTVSPLETLQDYSSNTTTRKIDSVIGDNESGQESPRKGLKMKLSELTKDTASNYEAVAKHLPENRARLTGDLLSALEDSVFIGPNRTFPIKDLAHAEATKALLDEVEDTEAKQTLLDTVAELIVKLTPVENTPETNIEDSVAAPEETPAEVAPPSVEPEIDSVTLPLVELDALKAEAAKVADLELDRDCWKQKAKNLQAELNSTLAVNTSLLKDHKEILAAALVDAQVSRGFKIEDKVETTKKYLGRSLESLKDQLEDIKTKGITGADHVASGERVPDPRLPDAEKDASQESTDNSRYAGTISEYQSIYYSGPTGPAKAQQFLQDARSKGLLPASVRL